MQEETTEPRTATSSEFSDDTIQEMLLLASRLREEAGGELDDDAIQAVAEATGAPTDYVRLAIRSIPEPAKRKRTIIDQLKSSFLAVEPNTRKILVGAVIGMGIGFFAFVGGAFRGGDSGLASILIAILYLTGLYNAATSRNIRTAAIAGMALGAVGQLSIALFGFFHAMFVPTSEISSDVFKFLLLAVGCAALSVGAHWFYQKNRRKLGLGDPAQDRHRLLAQLVELQNVLRSDEKHVTFLSLDIAGSTKMKAVNDPLSVEFTFNEYHQFVQAMVTKHGGQIHSTAGDGVTAVFDKASDGFMAGKAIQAGLFEFNTFRNRLTDDIELRAAIHTGSVLAPGREITNINFAHVIDVAAHLQKIAPIGTLVISEASAPYCGGPAVLGEETVSLEDCKGYVWRPKTKTLPIVPTRAELN